uniref:CCHC-type domain-containing protein n=1 Tax=Solanum lycopersicum TaxID=4081 RepID=K4B905_SOLLC
MAQNNNINITVHTGEMRPTGHSIFFGVEICIQNLKSRSINTIGESTGIRIVLTTIIAVSTTISATTTMATTASSITVGVSTTSAAIAFTFGILPSNVTTILGSVPRVKAMVINTLTGDNLRSCDDRDGGSGCYKCGEDDHYASECTNRVLTFSFGKYT